jgi:ribosomal-protein-alanine N-acetyltransferase
VRVFLGRATADDLSALAALQAACYTHPWTGAQMAAELALGPPGAVLVLRALAERGGTEVCAACAYRVASDEMQILDVSVDPRWRRRGLGRWLLLVAMRRAARSGAGTALLEVRKGNSQALRLYETLGFVRCGLRRGYYSAPVEDAILLRRDGLDALDGARGAVEGCGEGNGVELGRECVLPCLRG